MSSIQKKSALRTQNNEALRMIDERAKWIKEQRVQTEVSLNLVEFRKQQELYRTKSDEFEAVIIENDKLKIDVVSADLEGLKSDTVRTKSMETWHKILKRDPYLLEAVKVLGDW